MRALLVVAVLTSCSATVRRDDPMSEGRPRLAEPRSFPDVTALANGEQEPPSPEEAAEILKKKGGDWLYGQGLGGTLLNVGACIIFPPYALYLLTNFGLQVAGYEPLYVTDALPEEPREEVREVYREVTSVPGRVTSAVAGEEFREK